MSMRVYVGTIIMFFFLKSCFFLDNSILVIPPFHQFPSVSTRAMAMLNDYVLVGGNTMLVVGGPTGLLFINQNMAGTDGYGYELEPKWVEGPYEMQDAAMGSAFQVYINVHCV